jgi:hypothetical protein
MDTYGMPAPAADTPTALDARLPDGIALAAEELGVRKAHYDTPTFLALSVDGLAEDRRRKQQVLKQLKQQIDRRT